MSVISRWRSRASVPTVITLLALILSLLLTLSSNVLSFAHASSPGSTAPDGPGALSHFDLSRKDCLGTARNTTSKVWFTLANGVLSGEEPAGRERQGRQPPLAVALLHQAEVVGNPTGRGVERRQAGGRLAMVFPGAGVSGAVDGLGCSTASVNQ